MSVPHACLSVTVAEIFMCTETTSLQKLIGLRLVMFEPSTDQWYPGEHAEHAATSPRSKSLRCKSRTQVGTRSQVGTQHAQRHPRAVFRFAVCRRAVSRCAVCRFAACRHAVCRRVVSLSLRSATPIVGVRS
jgi:hypothetical protein